MALVRFWFDWNWAEAEREFERALALDRHHVTAHNFFGQLLAATDRAEEAEPHWQAALERDPLSPLTNGIVGSGLNFARRYEAARARCQKALELEPDHLQSLFAAAVCDVHLARYDEAVEEARRAASLAGRTPFFLGLQGMVCGLAQQRDEARALLAELQARSQQEYVMPFSLAWVHVGLGEAEPAIECLERAYEEHNTLLFALTAFREFDFLRGRPRFDALLRQMNLRAS